MRSYIWIFVGMTCIAANLGNLPLAIFFFNMLLFSVWYFECGPFGD